MGAIYDRNLFIVLATGWLPHLTLSANTRLGFTGLLGTNTLGQSLPDSYPQHIKLSLGCPGTDTFPCKY